MHQSAASQSSATRGRSNTLTRAQWAAAQAPDGGGTSGMPPLPPRSHDNATAATAAAGVGVAGLTDVGLQRSRTNSGAESYGAGFAPIYDPTSTGTGAANKARKVRARDSSERAKELYLEVRGVGCAGGCLNALL